MTDGWRLRVDRTRCAGTTICASTAPGRFEIGDDGQSRPTGEIVAPDDEVMLAAQLCPVEAISVSLAATGEELFPAEA